MSLWGEATAGDIASDLRRAVESSNRPYDPPPYLVPRWLYRLLIDEMRAAVEPYPLYDPRPRPTLTPPPFPIDYRRVLP